MKVEKDELDSPVNSKGTKYLSNLHTFSLASTQAGLNKPLSDLVKTTLESAASRSANTARAYQTAIGLFLQFLDREKGDLLPEEFQHWRPFASSFELERGAKLWKYKGPAGVLRLIDAGVLAGFKAWRENVGDSINTVAQRIPAVRTFLSVAYRDGIITHEQAQALGISIYRLKLKRDQAPVGRRLLPEEVSKLRAAPDIHSVKGARDRAILDTILFLGLRREEVANLQMKNFRMDKAAWWILITGKGGYSRKIKAHSELLKSLDQWLKFRGGQLGQTSTRLFVSIHRSGKPSGSALDASLISKIISFYGWKAGIAAERGSNMLSAHDLRRTCARNAYDNGANLILVQAMLGHKDPKTTALYIGTLGQEDTSATDFLKY